MKKLALFDLDGTLFNTNDVNYSAYEKAIVEQGYTLDYEYFCNYCNGRHFKDFIPDIVDHNEELYDIIHKRKKELYSKYLNKAKINVHLFEMIKLMKENYNLAVVTTASRKNACEILEYFKVFDLFDLVLTHEDVEHVKPDPEGFLKAMEHFGASSSDVIIFEDSLPGIEAALKTGASVVKIEHF